MNMNQQKWDESRVVRSGDGKFEQFLRPRADVDLDAGAEGSEGAGYLGRQALEERSRALESGGYVQAVAESAYQNPRQRGNTDQVNEWWNNRGLQAEYSDTGVGYEKMPDDWTPTRGSGNALSGHRRTYRRHYEGAGVSLRMPSAASIRSFASTQKGKSFDIPVEGSYDGGTVSGWVRCTAGDDGVWMTEGLGFENNQKQVAEAVSAVLESRRPTKALSGWESMDQRRAERMRRAGAKIQPVKGSSFIEGIGANPYAGVTFTKIRDKVYTNEVYTDIRNFASAPSKGKAYNETIKSQPSLGPAQVCDKCGGAWHPSFGAHICMRAGRHEPSELHDQLDGKRRQNAGMLAAVRSIFSIVGPK